MTHEVQPAEPDVNQTLLALCRNKLGEVAKAGETIPYSDVAALMGLANQSLTPYLMAIYDEDRDHDLTLVVVYKGTKYGRFRGELCVRPETTEECQEYDGQRERAIESGRTVAVPEKLDCIVLFV